MSAHIPSGARRDLPGIASGDSRLSYHLPVRFIRPYLSLIVPLAVVVVIVGCVWWVSDGLRYGNASSLHRAVMKRDPARVSQLVSDGVNVNQPMFAGLHPDTWGATPLHLAAGFNDVVIVEMLTRAGADKDAVDRLGYTPLHRALSNSADATAQSLIRAGAALNVPIGEGQAAYAIENSGTPMRTALQKASITTVRAMITAGADVMIEVGGDAMGWANAPDLLPKLQLLVDRGFSVEGKDAEARRPLHVAAINDDPASIEFLLDHGADIDASGDAYGFTPLLSAAYVGANEALTALLEHGADPDAAAKDFGSPIYAAAFSGKTETVRLLLAMNLGIDLQAGRSSDKATPLHFAYWNNDGEMVRLLIEAGADPNARTTDGRLPMQYRK